MLCYRLLKVGGTPIFDDYLANASKVIRPKIAIDAFLGIFAGAFEEVRRAYQLTLRPTR